MYEGFRPNAPPGANNILKLLAFGHRQPRVYAQKLSKLGLIGRYSAWVVAAPLEVSQPRACPGASTGAYGLKSSARCQACGAGMPLSRWSRRIYYWYILSTLDWRYVRPHPWPAPGRNRLRQPAGGPAAVGDRVPPAGRRAAGGQWFANLTSAQTRRAYDAGVKDFMRFTDITRPDEFHAMTRAHVIAWHDALVHRGLGGSTLLHRLSSLASMFANLCDQAAVTHNPIKGVARPKAGRGEGRTPALGDHQARGCWMHQTPIRSRLSVIVRSSPRTCFTRCAATSCAS